MAPVDTKTNRNAIEAAYKKVCDVNSGIEWAIFGYEGKSNVLKVDATGDGGFEEMTEDLNSGRIQYVYIRVQDPNSDLPKFVFINWQGEGAPDALKGSYANHVKDIGNVLRGAHVSINARNEEDIEEDAVLAKVAKSSVASFRRNDSNHVEEPTGPVGTNYTKIRPNQEIRTNVRDAFWQKQQEEEQRRKAEESTRLKLEREALERERKEREERETHNREKQIAEKMKTLGNKERPLTAAEEIRRLRITSVDQEDQDERASRAQRMQQERTAEARRLIKQRSVQAEEKQDSPPRPPVARSEQEPHRPSYQRQESPPQPEECWEPGIEEYERERELNAAVRNETTSASQAMQPPRAEPESEPSIPQANPEPDIAKNENLYDDAITQNPSLNTQQTAESEGLRAEALFDYEATEEGEISFNPGEIITNISKDYDGWWIGIGPKGDKGMFPSNYVKIID